MVDDYVGGQGQAGRADCSLQSRREHLDRIPDPGEVDRSDLPLPGVEQVARAGIFELGKNLAGVVSGVGGDGA